MKEKNITEKELKLEINKKLLNIKNIGAEFILKKGLETLNDVEEMIEKEKTEKEKK